MDVRKSDKTAGRSFLTQAGQEYSRHGKIWKPVLFLCLVLAGLGIFYWQVTAAQAEPQELWGMADAKEISVNSKVGGRVMEIFVEEGQAVKKGQLLARIDRDTPETQRTQAMAAMEAQYAQLQQTIVAAQSSSGTLAAALQSAQANAAQARATLGLAEKEEARYRQLLAQGAVSQQSYDTQLASLSEAQAAYDAALAGVESAQANMLKNEENQAAIEAAAKQLEAMQGELAGVDVTLEETEIRAPFDGVITKKYVEEGSLVSSSIPMFAVQDVTDNWVDFKVKETELGSYSLGDAVSLQGRNADVLLGGTIESISRKADFATQKAVNERGDRDVVTFNVKVRTDNSKVWPGMQFRLLKPGE